MLDGFQDWRRSTFGHAALSAALLWAALPPWDLWPLAWIAPAWWVMLIRRREFVPHPECLAMGRLRWIGVCVGASVVVTLLLRLCGVHSPPPPFVLIGWFIAMLALRWALTGHRPYRVLWFVGLVFWLAAVHWLRLPHWTTACGWISLAFYLSFYLPVFIGLSRVAVHRLRVPVILAAPTVWTGLELARGHLLTGFTMASLGHTQYRWLELIQLSDLAGAYGVGFVVMLVAACLARMVPCDGRKHALWPLAPALAVVAAALVYGHFRIGTENSTAAVPVALIQGSIDSEMKADESKATEVLRDYFALSRKALGERPEPELLIWPETMFRNTLISFDEDARMPSEFQGTEDEFWERLRFNARDSREFVEKTARVFRVPLILGIDRTHFPAGEPQFFNAAVLVTPSGGLIDSYDKMHLVTFGEYVPFATYFPWIHHLMPMRMKLTEGVRPASFATGGLRYAPNICYETVVPHLIRRQINTLKARGEEPDVLVNLTNDGWFYGSSELDMHLICGVFRAVECRKPLLIAANTGISAWIDGDGRIRGRGPSREAAVVRANVSPDGRGSWYLRHGDWPAGVCLAACIAAAVVGIWSRFRPSPAPRVSNTANGRKSRK